MKKENKNFLYNVVYQFLIYLFPLLITPYISRVLGATNIGIYSYTYSIVYYFMLLSMLGINNYGNREVARNRDDKKKLSETFFSIYYLQLFITTVMIVAYVVFLVFFCKNYKLYFVIQLINLVSVCFDINWLFFGLEKFKTTINRNLFIKIFSLILIFVLVKNQNCLWIYILIMAMATLISQLYLVFKAREFVFFQKPSIEKSKIHLKECIVLFIPVLAYGIYRVMDKTMLGFFSVQELGYYENAEKIINIPVSVITALGTVMLPKMSYELREKNGKYKEIIVESMKIALCLATIMALGLCLVSNEMSLILFGQEFIKSGYIICFLASTIVFSALANVIRTQYLIPIGNNKVYVTSTIMGAVINLIFNLILIKPFGAYGACVGTVMAEFAVMFYQLIKTRKELETKKYIMILLENILKSAIIVTITYLVTFKISNVFALLLSRIIIAVILFVIINNKLIKNFCGIGGKKVENKN